MAEITVFFLRIAHLEDQEYFEPKVSFEPNNPYMLNDVLLIVV